MTLTAVAAGVSTAFNGMSAAIMGLSAFFRAPWVASLTPQLGTTPVSFSTEATFGEHTHTQPDGQVVRCEPGELRFVGARRVCNMLQVSDDITDPLVTGNFVTIVDENTFIHQDSQNGNISWTSRNAAVLGDVIIFSVRVRYVSGTVPSGSDIQLRLTGAVVAMAVDIGDEIAAAGTGWLRLAFKSDPALVPSAWQCQLKFNNTLAGDTTYQVENVQCESILPSATAPSEPVSSGTGDVHGSGADGVKYFSTTHGNTVSGVIVTENDGSALSNLDGLLLEPSVTNRITQSRATDTSPWQPANSVTHLSAVLAPSGRVEAIPVYDGNAGATGYDFFSAGCTVVAGANYNFNAYVRKTTDSRENASGLTIANSASPTNYIVVLFNTDTGAYGSPFSVGGEVVHLGTKVELDESGDWWRVTVAFKTVTITTVVPFFFPAGGKTSNLGVLDIAAIGTSTPWGLQIHERAFATSLIPTNTSIVMRDTITLSVPIANFSEDEGAIAFDFTPQFDTAQLASGSYSVLSIDGATAGTSLFYYTSAGSFVLNENGVSTSTLAQALVAGQTYHIKMRWSVANNVMEFDIDGTPGGAKTGTFTGFTPTGALEFNLGNLAFAGANVTTYSEFPSAADWGDM